MGNISLQNKLYLTLDVDKNIFINTFNKLIHTHIPVNRIIYESIKNSFEKTLVFKNIKNWKLREGFADYGIKNCSLHYLSKNGLEIYYVITEINTYKNIEEVEICEPVFSIYKDFNYGWETVKTVIKKKELKTINKYILEIKLLHISKEFFAEIYDFFAKNCTDTCDNNYLQDKYDYHFGEIGFECKICGKIYTCSCFKHSIEIVGNRNDIIYKDKICHLCTKRTPNRKYVYAGFSTFKTRYFPYIENIAIKKGKRYTYEEKDSFDGIKIDRESENEVREMVGYPKIGEKWINETHLYKMICFLFEKYEILREASPPWLGKLRLDIFIPELKVAIEYQGEQHYNAISRFGGEEGLIKTQKRDRQKKSLCKENDISLVYFKYNEDITDKLIEKRLNKFLH